MKKIIILLTALFIACSSASIFADSPTSVSIEQEGENYVATISSDIAKLNPTVQVNTNFGFATVYKNTIETNNVISSSIKDGVVSFDVSESGQYIVTENIEAGKSDDCETNASEAIRGFIAKYPGMTITSKSGLPIDSSKFSSNVTISISNKEEKDIQEGILEQFEQSIIKNIDEENVVGVKFFDIKCEIESEEISEFGNGSQGLIPFKFKLSLAIDPETQEIRVFKCHNEKVSEVGNVKYKDEVLSFGCYELSTFAFVVANKNDTTPSRGSHYNVVNTSVK